MTSTELETRMMAAELVFGLINADEAETIRNALATDPIYIAAHEQWTGIAAGLSTNLSGNASVNLWKRIRKDVQSEIQGYEVTRQRNRREARALLTRRIAAGVVLCCVVAPFAAQLAWPPSAPFATAPVTPVTPVGNPSAGPQLPISAHLVGEADFGTVFIDLQKSEMTTMLARAPASNVTYEVWLFSGSEEPRSLGILTSSRTTKILSGSESPRPQAGARVGVSIEPSGGSPTRRPTSPIIATGNFLVSPRF